jgi:hypothetical protein
MAWKRDDIRGLVGSHVVIREPADDRTFWTDPHRYTGDWVPLESGRVTATDYTANSGGYTGRLIYDGGGWFGWISGQPLQIIETKER